MLKHTFELNQQRLEDEVLALGSQVEEMLTLSVQTLRERNIKEAMHLIANNSSFNQKCTIIETDTLTLLETEWPTDHDLYVLASILEIAQELEHIHDLARCIAEINLKLDTETLFDQFADFLLLAKMTGNMLHKALKAFSDKNLDLACFVPGQHREVNGLYQRIHQALLESVKTNQLSVNQAFYLSQVGQQLGRVADRTINICEWVVFSITGEMRKLN